MSHVTCLAQRSRAGDAISSGRTATNVAAWMRAVRSERALRRDIASGLVAVLGVRPCPGPAQPGGDVRFASLAESLLAGHPSS
jgi:hypothetical protein